MPSTFREVHPTVPDGLRILIPETIICNERNIAVTWVTYPHPENSVLPVDEIDFHGG